MDISEPYIFALRFNRHKITKTFAYDNKLKKWDSIAHFSKPLTSSDPKLYVFSDGSWPYYVGITRQSLPNRFRSGFKASSKNKINGYGGYAFKEEETVAIVHVWIDTNPDEVIIQTTKGKGKDKIKQDKIVACLKNMETIEAELVYRIRQEGAWPKYQTEIHFSPFDDAHTTEVNKIFETYTELKGKPALLPSPTD